MKKLKDRDNYIGPPECFVLAHVCETLYRAFGEMPYLVGSATEGLDYRDVDIRMIFSDEKFDALFGGVDHSGQVNLFWSVLCTAIGEYIANRTGLKIDFQIQQRSRVSKADWDKKRTPLAMFPDNVKPKWKDL